MVTKEELLPPAELAALHSEQRALVDLLILTRSAALVGHGVSTFSCLARDLRALRMGRDRVADTVSLLPWPWLPDAWVQLVPLA